MTPGVDPGCIDCCCNGEKCYCQNGICKKKWVCENYGWSECPLRPCPPGYFSATGKGDGGLNYTSGCTKCPAGKFNDGKFEIKYTHRSVGVDVNVGATSCTSCPVGYFCESGSSDKQNCTAAAGSFCAPGSSSAAGSLCPVGYFCEGGSNDKQTCTADAGSFCAAGSSSAAGSLCPVGYYCVGGASDKEICPANTTSVAGSASLASCACNSGSTGPDGGPCTSCVAGKYKVVTGSGACADCPSGASSPEGSASPSECNCVFNEQCVEESSLREQVSRVTEELDQLKSLAQATGAFWYDDRNAVDWMQPEHANCLDPYASTDGCCLDGEVARWEYHVVRGPDGHGKQLRLTCYQI